MAKLNEKQRSEAKQLLEEYQTICEMLSDVDRRIFQLYLTSSREGTTDDFAEVSVSRKGAKDLLIAEKEWTKRELVKLGIEVV